MVLSCTVLKYGDLLAENCLFFLPLSHLAPPLPIFPLEFRGEVNREESRVMGYPQVKTAWSYAWVVLTQCQRVSDGQTDRRTDLLYLIQRSAQQAMLTRCKSLQYRCRLLRTCDVRSPYTTSHVRSTGSRKQNAPERWMWHHYYEFRHSLIWSLL